MTIVLCRISNFYVVPHTLSLPESFDYLYAFLRKNLSFTKNSSKNHEDREEFGHHEGETAG